MPKKAKDSVVPNLTDLPLLTTRRACIVADCSRQTLQLSGPAPVGRRGRTFVYRTEDILRWLSSGFESTPRTAKSARPWTRPEQRGDDFEAYDDSDVIERLHAIRRGSAD